jgi:branched-chain amino acid transport system permease protein
MEKVSPRIIERPAEKVRRSPSGVLLFFIGAAGTGLLVDDPYHLQLLSFIGINTLLAMGLNMLMGYAGQISLGHAAFFGLGAYVSAILTVHLQFSPWLALPCALLLTALVAFLVGMPTLKLSGYYLGMGTLGFGIIVHIVFREWSSLTGGSSGLIGIPPLSIGPISFDSEQNAFFLVWGTVGVGILICRRLVDSRIGRALRAIHDSEHAARALGVDTRVLKLRVFVFSAIFAAVAGFFYAHIVGFVSPESFNFLVSVRIVTMVVIGGMASIWGALLGAGLLSLLPEWLHAFSDFEMIVYGLILMLVMILMPRGLTRGALDIYERALKARGKGGADA